MAALSDDSDSSSRDFTSDNLRLNSLIIPDIPKEIIFPNELNQYLQEQVQFAVFEKARLQRKLNQNETELSKCKSEISTLKSQLEKLEKCEKNCPLSPTNHTDLATTYNSKIVDLSKSLREKCCDLEKYKTRCSKLEKVILELQKQKVNEPEEKKKEEIVEKEDSESKIKYLQDNLTFTKAKLCEARNLNIKLKNDFNKANKLLLQEIGENLETLQKNASSNNNWRGRAQIICDLQQKNHELKEKLKAYHDKEQGKVDLRKEENKRIEVLQRENQELKKISDELKKKLDAFRAKCKVYESDAVVLKTKLVLTTEQNENNNQLVSQLTAQIANFNSKQNNVMTEKQKYIESLEKENKNHKTQLSKEKCTIEKLLQDLRTKEKCIEMMKTNVESKRSTSVFESTNADIRKLEAERLRLIELSDMLNKRLEVEKEAHYKTQSNFLFERHRAAKYEAKLARLKTTNGYSTNRSNNQSYSSLKQFGNTEDLENQLELAQETIKSLETKLNLERQERQIDFEKFSHIIKNQSLTNVKDDY